VCRFGLVVLFLSACTTQRFDLEYGALCTAITGSSDCRDGGPSAPTDAGEPDASVPDAGQCIDTMRDPLNCGACGQRCEQRGPGPWCVLGRCTPAELTATSSPLDLPHGLRLEAGRVFVTESNFGHRRNRVVEITAEGELLEWVTNQPAISDVVVWKNTLFWTTWDPGGVFSKPMDGGLTEPLVNGGPGGTFFALAVEGDVLFAVRNSFPAALVVKHLNPTGTDVPEVSHQLLGTGGATGVAVCGEDAFVTIQRPADDRGGVIRVRGPGTSDAGIEWFAKEIENPWGIACNERSVWVTETTGQTRLLRIDRFDGGVETLARSLVRPRGIVLDGDDTFVLEFSPEPDGGPTRALLIRPDAGLDELSSSVFGGIFPRLDARSLYWVNHRTPGSVVRIPRPLR
jgi:hypothetical protein